MPTRSPSSRASEVSASAGVPRLAETTPATGRAGGASSSEPGPVEGDSVVADARVDAPVAAVAATRASISSGVAGFRNDRLIQASAASGMQTLWNPRPSASIVSTNSSVSPGSSRAISFQLRVGSSRAAKFAALSGVRTSIRTDSPSRTVACSATTKACSESNASPVGRTFAQPKRSSSTRTIVPRGTRPTG